MIFILEDNDERIENFKAALGTIESHVEKTVPESIEWLSENKQQITLFSLDNDLYVPDYEGDEGEGWALCEWILANFMKTPVLIHSTNIYAADKMKALCEQAGWQYSEIPPYNGFEWIHESWIQGVCSFIPG
ncbi:MAG: hypothetical protein HQK65_15665 [Desulfamplus sp.]|nr:hypothetical protein [Desulfamplus sp.]